MKFVDLTHTIINNISVYPGDDTVKLSNTKSYFKEGYNNSNLEISMHVGTHIDGPMHLTSSKMLINEIEISRFIGRGYLIDARGEKKITLKDDYFKIQTDDIVLIYANFDKIFGTIEYYENHPILSDEFTKFLIERKVKMLGLDFPSPDNYPFLIHRQLLENNILIIENLTNLESLLENNFDIYALPLKISADSAPARVVAIIDYD
ncbi:MAG: hypothetical protein K0Q49_1635 [Haloplasmataceae bacterium]|jgi:kynurenine formamidase|nr:hypothetical protein [Haloplasmataceae bacterium]